MTSPVGKQISAVILDSLIFLDFRGGLSCKLSSLLDSRKGIAFWFLPLFLVVRTRVTSSSLLLVRAKMGDFKYLFNRK